MAAVAPSATASVSWDDGDATLEADLVARAQAGDQSAIGELYRLHFGEIYRFLLRRVGNRDDAEDLTMQTFLKMVEAIGRFRWQSSAFGAWLTRIARNLAIDHYRERSRLDLRDELPELRGSTPSAEEETLAAVGAADVVALLRSLGEDQRRALALRYVLAWSNAEVAHALDKTPGAVKALQHRGLEQIRGRVDRDLQAA